MIIKQKSRCESLNRQTNNHHMLNQSSAAGAAGRGGGAIPSMRYTHLSFDRMNNKLRLTKV